MSVEQHMFNHVVSHLKQQGKRAMSKKEGSCSYRMLDEDGKELRCAIGACLRDDIPFGFMSGYGIYNIPEDSFKPKFKGAGDYFMNSLQQLHDGWTQPTDMYRGSTSWLSNGLKELAHEYALEIPKELEEWEPA